VELPLHIFRTRPPAVRLVKLDLQLEHGANQIELGPELARR